MKKVRNSPSLQQQCTERVNSTYQHSTSFTVSQIPLIYKAVIRQHLVTSTHKFHCWLSQSKLDNKTKNKMYRCHEESTKNLHHNKKGILKEKDILKIFCKNYGYYTIKVVDSYLTGLKWMLVQCLSQDSNDQFIHSTLDKQRMENRALFKI